MLFQTRLEERVDDCEQYSRRLCVRIDNMAVPSGVIEHIA